MWLLIVIFLSTILIYVILRHLRYWKNRGIPGPRPYPFVGNMAQSLIGAKSLGEVIGDIYTKYEGYPFVGVFKGISPALLIRDTDFIKFLTTKDFKCFQNNDIFVDKEIDPIFGRNPFVLKGEEWKKCRAQLTPCFTTIKMKSIFPLVEAVSKTMVTFVENQKEASISPGLEAKELCTKFTLDNVAACAFGLEAKCFENPNSEFRDLAHKFLSPDSWSGYKFMLMMYFPKLFNFFSLKMISKFVEDHLMEIIKTTLKYREENNIVRSDFLDYLHQLSKTSTNFTDVDVTAHAASFFGDGFETSSQMMSFLLFELAMNPDVQSKLREEINHHFEKDNKQLTFDAIFEMPYLNACMNESMRKYPPVFFLAKTCNERYTYTPSNPDFKNITVTVEPGTCVILPVLSLHMDSKFYYSPEKFIPERFLDKDSINRYAYLPFGEGPRACLGQRFGILQIKVGVAYLVKNFVIKVNGKTKVPLQFNPWYPLLSPIGGLWLNYIKI